MLSQRYSLHDLSELITPRGDYRPHPTIGDRAAWAGLPAAVRAAHVQRGEAYLNFDYPSLPATLFLQYSRAGNRRNYERPHFERRGALEMLVTGECMEGEGRFLDDIANGIWAICEETYWGVPAHINVQRAGNTLPDAAEPTVDLFAAETGTSSPGPTICWVSGWTRFRLWCGSGWRWSWTGAFSPLSTNATTSGGWAFACAPANSG